MKRKMKIAGGKHNRNLSGSHFTTAGFGDLSPIFWDEFVPGDEVTINPTLFARSATLTLPNMAKLSFSNRCFYCTYNSVWRFYEDFLQGNPVTLTSDQGKEVLKKVPYITQFDFIKILTGNFGLNPFFARRRITLPSTQHVPTDTIDYDFWIEVNEAGYGEQADVRIEYYSFTKQGKALLKIFQSLDYNFDLVNPGTTWSSVGVPTNVGDTLSAMPLLCLLKVFYDYYIPSNLRPSSAIDNLLFYLNNEMVATDPHVGWDVLFVALTSLTLYHDSNYFTSQWLSPIEPAPYLSQFGSLASNDFNLESDDSLTSQPNYSSYVDGELPVGDVVQSTRAFGSTSSQSASVQNDEKIYNLTFTQMKVINQLRAFIMRNNLVGSRPIQRLFARFGVNVPELQLQMSQYFGNMEVPIQTQAIANTAEDTGELSAMSYADSTKHTFKFNVNQFGCCFILSSIDVPSTYVSGISRKLYHLSPFSFYTPEFDDAVMQATRGNEIAGRYQEMPYAKLIEYKEGCGLDANSTFGFIERYACYKYGRNRVTGDYNIATLRNPINGYILPREAYDKEKFLLAIRDSSVVPDNLEADTLDVLDYYDWYTPVSVSSQSDAYQFNRIYRDISGIADPFSLDCSFDINVFGNVKTNDLDNFINGDGKEFSYEKNGMHVN